MSATTRGPLDRPNGDLKAGDKIVILRWCGALENIPQAGQPCRLVLTRDGIHVLPEEEERPTPNRMLLGALLEVIAVSYPYAIMQMHSILPHGGHGTARLTICLTEFEAARATPEYVAALIPTTPAPTPTAPAAACPTSPLVTTVFHDGRHHQGHPELP